MAGDAGYPSVSLLLHGRGASGSRAIVDNGAAAKAIAVGGNAAISSAQSKFDGTSIVFDGTANTYLSTPHATDLNLVSGDFTVEGWIRYTALSSGNMQIVNKDGDATHYPSWAMSVSSAGKLNGVVSNSGGMATQQVLTSVASLTAAAWNHVAFVRSGSTLYLFLNGNLEVSIAQSVAIVDGGRQLGIGGQTGAALAEILNGYLTNLRVTKGLARYTANFSVPMLPFPDGQGAVSGAVTDGASGLARVLRAFRRDTGAQVAAVYSGAGDANFHSNTLLIHGDGLLNGSIRDASVGGRAVTVTGTPKLSAAQAKWLGRSIAFDGAAASYLSLANSADFAIESLAACTVELWVYRSVAGVLQGLIGTRPSAATQGWALRFNANNTLQLYFTGGASLTSVATVLAGGWHHIAFARNAGSGYLFIDGVQAATGAMANGTASADPLRIGVETGAIDSPLTGFMSDIRITRGVARYTGAFTPPADRHPDKASGALGDYSFWTPTTDEIDVVVLDDDAGTVQNDLIARVIPA